MTTIEKFSEKKKASQSIKALHGPGFEPTSVPLQQQSHYHAG